MRIKDIMTPAVETISPLESAIQANERMWRQRIHHLVVTDNNIVVGVLSDTDLGGTDSETIDNNLLVRDVMSSPVIQIDVNETLKRAQNIMEAQNISCLPVVTQGKLVGIVTQTDLKTLEKRGAAQPPFESTDPHQGPYVQREFREETGTSKFHHTDWPGR